jgi:hypothetical protein
VVERVTSSSRRRSNAAVGLRDIGRPAIPRLINLLRDRRPIRAVGFWRVFHPSRTVLRYQDVAIEILQGLIPKRIYARSTTAAPEHHGRAGAPRPRRSTAMSCRGQWAWTRHRHLDGTALL